MMAQAFRDWSVFKQSFADHWDRFKHAHPRYHNAYYDGLVAKMLDWATLTTWAISNTAVSSAVRASLWCR